MFSEQSFLAARSGQMDKRLTIFNRPNPEFGAGAPSGPNMHVANELAQFTLPAGVQNESMHCRWRSWRVIGARSLAVDVVPDSVPSVSGLVSVAQMLMPDVEDIYTFCEGVIDGRFWLEDGQWKSLNMRSIEIAPESVLDSPDQQ